MGSCYSCLNDEINPLDLSVRDLHKVPNYRLECLSLDKCNVEFLSKILQWKTKWFHDDYNPKPNYSSILQPEYTLIKTSETYKTWDDYRKTMEPFIILECYQSLLEAEDDPNLKNRLHGKICDYRRKNFNGKILTEFTVKKIIKTGDEFYLPKLGDLLIVKFKNQTEIFGYLENMRRKTLQVYSSGPSVYQCYFTVLIENLNIPLNPKIELQSKKSICLYLKMLQALHDLSKSAFGSLILQPDHVGYKISQVRPWFVNRVWTDAELKIILGVVKTAKNSKPHVCLIQGGPGSNKYALITCIILELFKKNIKILLCSHSDKALDAVLSKVLNLKKALEQTGKNLNVVRVFSDDEKDPNIRSLSLEVIDEITLSKGKHFFLHRIEEQILPHAHVIVSTFSSCCTNKMEYIFGKNGQEKIPVCIVDKAEESMEIMNLIPLMLGVKTLVLVGDDPQQPSSTTVLSKEAKDHGMDVALFTRVQKYYQNRAFLTSPVMKLNE